MKLKWNQWYWDFDNSEWKTKKARYYARNIFKTIGGNRCVLGEGEVCGTESKCWIIISDPNGGYYYEKP